MAGQALPPLATLQRIDLPVWRGEIAENFLPADLPAALAHLTDPGAATQTLHWGRNYLYATRYPGSTSEEVVVKQFREESWVARRRTARRGSKAERSFKAARAVLAAGVPTPEPILWLDAKGNSGVSFYICRRIEGIEVRLLFRAAAAGREREEFPDLDLPQVLAEIGRLARRLHDAGIRHRDLSVGNLLVRPGAPGEPPALSLLDLNRARQGVTLGLPTRMREFSRLALFRPEHRDLLLAGYFGRTPTAAERALLAFYQGAFEAKNRTKRGLRGALRGTLSALRPRRAHPHIPAAPEGAASRDKMVWDRLSDQPHQHAGRFEKLTVRLADTPAHLNAASAALLAAPRIRRRFKELESELFQGPRPFTGIGIGLRPEPEDPEGLLALVDELGCRNILLRLHPWQEEHHAEEELAKALAARGCDLLFALPQNRDLVRDPARWRASLERIAEIFLPYGHRFQIGQAINRSKWGIWTLGEYFDLAKIASDVLRARPAANGHPVELLGPAVIDFELYATASALNATAPGLHFDAVSSLLYVDRRGAPENTQMGLDTVGKLRLLRAIAETAKNVTETEGRRRSWVTEVNWPLWEGPHSPAGKSVSVDEQTQADYLSRYYLLALASGMTERVYWWQMIARGYGLVDREEGGTLRRRPSFHSLRTLIEELDGATFERRLESPAGTYLLLFRRGDGATIVAGWSVGGTVKVEMPIGVVEVVDRDGRAVGVGK
ncbi:MAG TPA: lipopolysaccharide kinase InaA family protein, partial [Thermoanaerobaculia bacterium]|nr:lipopolysaccharide kinase InaA family protein [Thermoanaerobaculia bacterium]